MPFADNLKKICKARGTNPTALCKELGLSTSKVHAWYNGSLPKEDIMVQLADKLQCSVMDFFDDEDNNANNITDSVVSQNSDVAFENSHNVTNNYYQRGCNESTTTRQPSSTDSVFELIGSISKMNDSQVKRLIKYAEFLRQFEDEE